MGTRLHLAAATAVASLAVTLASASPAVASSGCDRDCLIQKTDQYLAAMLAHDPAAAGMLPHAKVTENGVPINLGDGLFRSATDLRFRQYFVDPQQGEAGFFGILQDERGPTLLALRLKIRHQFILESESLITHQGDHALFAPDRLPAPDPIYDEVLAPSQRVSRAELTAAANAYFEGIEDSSAEAVPFADDCTRRENGVVTAGGTARFTCPVGLPRFTYIETIRDRRYPVIDEERGLVLAVVMFDMPTQNRSLRLAELFKVVDGKITRIEAFLLNAPLGAETGWPASMRWE